MNDYLLVGYICSTHGIKGELKIKSNIDHKELIFKPGNKLYMGNNYLPETITTYRVHKGYDMVTFNNYQNINEVLKYLKSNVYYKRSELNLINDDYMLEDLINFNVIDNAKIVGKVTNFVYNNLNTLLVITSKKDFYVPIHSNYIKKIDLKKKEIITDKIEDFM